jgi:hypothetical protein
MKARATAMSAGFLISMPALRGRNTDPAVEVVVLTIVFFDASGVNQFTRISHDLRDFQL